MAKKTKDYGVKTTDYRHTGEKRANIPPAKIAAEGKVPKVPTVRYQYSSHLPPVLRFDPSGETDKLPELMGEAGRRPLTASEQKLLAEALRNDQPWLEWAGKREQNERRLFEVDPVALHIHERVSTQAIIRALAREDVQRDLFADPQQPYAEAVQFYKHDVDWANRLILGDSLQVMASLARRETLAGKVQMIYMDPPYGIKFGSNFQPLISRRDVKDRDQDLTREPEMVRAYRDTWTLGIHSYLSYLRDRLLVARGLLADSGSIFVQISDENVHRVRSLLDEVFGPANFCGVIGFVKTSSQTSELFAPVFDYLLWYCSDRHRVKFRPIFAEKNVAELVESTYRRVEEPSGMIRYLRKEELEDTRLARTAGSLMCYGDMVSQSGSESTRQPFRFRDRVFEPRSGGWKTSQDGLGRLAGSERLGFSSTTLLYKRYFDDFPLESIANLWTDTQLGGFLRDEGKIYVVQTPTKVIERCVLVTTDPGDIVFDPTCGSGTTAYVAEQWGRRWITCETSRVALSLARQRLMTARFPYYQLRALTAEEVQRNPQSDWLTDPTSQLAGKTTFKCMTVSHITLKSIARNAALDPVLEKHEVILGARLKDLNEALKHASRELRQRLASKLADKQRRDGKKAITEADRRRWDLPEATWHGWEVPFDADPDWPRPLREALVAYRAAWQAKMDEVNACTAANAEMEELVDQPEVVHGVVRVAGPFTVEGVRPEELSLGADGLFDPTPNEPEADAAPKTDGQNLQAYLAQMVGHLRIDGLTFLGNKHRKFSRLDPLFEDASASLIHAEGAWEGSDSDKGNTVAVSFGPQHGPVTALQVEEAIRAAKQYDEIVMAGFSFDAEAFAVVEEQGHPKLRIHLAQIRPDLNEAMHGLLKDTPNSELFSVFGQPEIELKESKDEWVCTLKGVDIYNPLDNTVRSSGADKVAAWFLDSDFDGRCFCITQAFFPDQNAWDKIAKALGSSADPEAFEKLKGTTSLPFHKGKFGRIAVKVIDPRGNEVMAIRKLG
jgi:adenine-specific DNA-methyltransferase